VTPACPAGSGPLRQPRAALQPYPAYRDSGVPWLGEIPAHWGIVPGRACYREKKAPNAGLKERTVLSLSYGQIVVKPEEKLHGLVPASFETYQIIDPGDIVVRPTDLQNDWNSLRFGLSRHRGIITSAYMCLHTKDVMTREYGHLLLHAYDLKKVFCGLGSGLRQNLDWGDFKYLPCLVPPPDEQAAIVRYLDHADRRIRRFIRAKQKLIALLNEETQAIIHRAVTRGLDPNVRLKSSGMEWLGDVPEHWERRRLKTLLRPIDRRSSTGTETLLSLRRDHGIVVYADHFTRPPQGASMVGFKIVEAGQLVVNRLQANNGLIFCSSLKGLVSPDYSVFEARSPFDMQYLGALLRLVPYRAHFRRESTGLGTGTAGFLRLYDDRLLETVVWLPPIREQSRIMTALGEATLEASRLIEREHKQLELLHGYRTRLIADVVTGKLDVREAAAALPQKEDQGEDTISEDSLTDEAETDDDVTDDVLGEANDES
jgi:type I restriction enzyme S subunit